MKSICPTISLLLSVLAMSSMSYAKDDLPALTGPYLGQNPSGLTPEPFAPGIVTTSGFDDGGVFSPDMDEFYFIRKRLDNGKFETVIYKKGTTSGLRQSVKRLGLFILSSRRMAKLCI